MEETRVLFALETPRLEALIPIAEALKVKFDSALNPAEHRVECPAGGDTAGKIRDRNAPVAPSELETYTPLAEASMAGPAMKVHAAHGRQEVLEGPEAEGVVIVEFPSMAEAKAWYDSPANRAAREHRFRGADYRALIVEGVWRPRPRSVRAPRAAIAAIRTVRDFRFDPESRRYAPPVHPDKQSGCYGFSRSPGVKTAGSLPARK